MAMNYDTFLGKIGEFGLYQKKLLFMLCLPVMSAAMHGFSTLFINNDVPFRCRLPIEDENAEYSVLPDGYNESLVFPWDPHLNAPSPCLRYDANFTPEYFQSGKPADKTVPCTSWVYDGLSHESTVSEWDLVCDRGWLVPIVDTALMSGMLIGSLIIGNFADRLGRKAMYFISLVLQVTFGILNCVSNGIYLYIVTKVFLGISDVGVLLTSYIFAVELVGPGKRLIACLVYQAAYGIGIILLTLTAYIIHGWRLLQITITLPGVIYYSFWWFITESVRWLLIRGQTEKARKILIEMAAENNATVDDSEISEFIMQYEEIREREVNELMYKHCYCFNLLAYRELRKTSLLLFFFWSVTGSIYYWMSNQIVNVGGDLYRNVVLSGVVESLSYILLFFCLRSFGRKVMIFCSMALTGVCFFCVAGTGDQPQIRIIFALCAKATISCTHATIYLICGEMYPTVLRSTGLGMAFSFAGIGTLCAPFLLFTVKIWTWLPMIIVGVFLVTSGLLAFLFLFPESESRNLPETIEDVQNY